MTPADLQGDVVAEITQGGERLVIVASRLPRDVEVPVRVADERRLADFLDRAHALAPDVTHDDGTGGVRSLCSAHFVSGAGWAWRVTAELVRERAAGDGETTTDAPTWSASRQTEPDRDALRFAPRRPTMPFRRTIPKDDTRARTAAHLS